MASKIKTTLAAVILISSVSLIGGCETAAGVTKGVAYGVAYTAEGAAKDTVNLWQAIIKADKWMQENLW
jgi:hypothetical protein